MRSAVATAILLPALTLAACSTSVIEESDRAVPQAANAYSGRLLTVDKEQSYVSFLGKSSIVDHEGAFDEYTFELTTDTTSHADLEKATIVATIDIDSARTDADGLTGHLKKADFFDVENYPTATFTSTKIVSKGGNQYEVTGDLTVKGQTKTVVMQAEITDDYLRGTFEMPRKEFGVGNDSYGDKLLNDTVPVEVKL
ncbi:MAG TPA: YceI family protein, partial [Acidimicrobiales bacterium]|nr:YceI family protein [Acidimicrobiales bacterium]